MPIRVADKHSVFENVAHFSKRRWSLLYDGGGGQSLAVYIIKKGCSHSALVGIKLIAVYTLDMCFYDLCTVQSAVLVEFSFWHLRLRSELGCQTDAPDLGMCPTIHPGIR